MITASFEPTLVCCGRAAIFCRSPNQPLAAQSAVFATTSRDFDDRMFRPRAYTPGFKPAFDALKRRKVASRGINSGLYLTGGNSEELHYC